MAELDFGLAAGLVLGTVTFFRVVDAFFFREAAGVFFVGFFFTGFFDRAPVLAFEEVVDSEERFCDVFFLRGVGI